MVTKSHGGSSTRLYRIWHAMLSRCRNPGDRAYYNYGARGITVDPRWDDFATFRADMGERPAGRSLDRIDNDGPYSPENCRWATRGVQSRNTRRNRVLVHDGRSMPLTDWADLMGMRMHTLRARIEVLGWSVERALLTPVRTLRRR